MINPYNSAPKNLGPFSVDCQEMMFYQYLLVKKSGATDPSPIFEKRLDCFSTIIGASCCDFIGTYGLDSYNDSNVYLTAKHLYQPPNTSFNRFGWHCDGFMTDDINYIWCDNHPTIFCIQPFSLTMDDAISMGEMEEQARKENEVTFPENSLLRLDQYNVHKVMEIKKGCMRTFVKVSFSEDKYDLKGNSKNYLLNYDWEFRERDEERNIPQKMG